MKKYNSVMAKYRIGEIAQRCGISERTIRYYEEEGLISVSRSSGGHRWYRDEDVVYIKRILELKGLGFSIAEIRKIIELREEDESGNKRRAELLSQYRQKISEDMKKLEVLKAHIDELEWHVHQLEKAEDGFTACPGALCASCGYKSRCVFFRVPEDISR